MGLMSDKAAANVRSTRDRTFDTAIVILGRQSVSNDAGGQTEAWQQVASYQGRLRHARPMDYLEVRGGQRLPVGTWFVMLPTEATVDPASRIQAGGRTFTVIGSDLGRSDALVQTLVCVLVADV